MNHFVLLNKYFGYDMLNQLILFSWFAGITVFLGGLSAYFFEKKAPNNHLKEEIVHFITSFGGGIILSAVALVLVPKGLHHLSVMPVVITFLSGALIFLIIDRYLAQKGGSTATLLAMLMDFIPEAIALGAVFAVDMPTAILLAIFIGLQNFPEAFLSYRDLIKSGFSAKTTLMVLFCLSFSGIFSALLGHFVISDYPALTAYLMIFASGGILYLLFQDIIPESKLEGNYVVSLGAIFGFVIGMIGEKLI